MAWCSGTAAARKPSKPGPTSACNSTPPSGRRREPTRPSTCSTRRPGRNCGRAATRCTNGTTSVASPWPTDGSIWAPTTGRCTASGCELFSRGLDSGSDLVEPVEDDGNLRCGPGQCGRFHHQEAAVASDVVASDSSVADLILAFE